MAKERSLTAILEDYARDWAEEIVRHKWLLLLASSLLLISNFVGFYAGNYVDKVCSNAVSDLILDRLPATDLGLLFIYGYIAIISILFLYPLFFKIRELHIVISQFSLVFLIRSFFIILTHMKMPPEIIPVTWPTLISPIAFNNDLFFSGHVATAFLGFLLFKESKIKWFFLIASLLMGFTVLGMHQHYSIDVFAAFFITYGSYKIGHWFFSKIQR
jgi:membrane-associated phospholipid phosphatase